MVTTITRSTISGHANGPSISATFNSPNYITFDGFRNIIIVMDFSNNLIRTIVNPTPSSQPSQQPTQQPTSQPTHRPTGYRGLDVFTLAGGGLTGNSSGCVDGTGTNALLNGPMGGSVNAVTGDLYIADTGNNLIRKVTSLGEQNLKLLLFSIVCFTS